MSDKYARLGEAFKNSFVPKQMNGLMVGVVKEVTGNTCKVQIGELVISGVRLKVQMGDSSQKLITTPAVGALVLCGSLTGDLKDLIVLKTERVAKLQYDENGLSIEVDSESGKIKVQNAGVSLKDLFDDLKRIIESIKVFTPSGPSGTPLPDTITSLGLLQAKINQLLN